MNKQLLIGIILALIILLILTGSGLFLAYKHFVLDVRRPNLLQPYQGLDNTQTAIVLIPAETSETQDISAIQNMGNQMLLRGNNAVVMVCVESQIITGAYQCMPYVFVRQVR